MAKLSDSVREFINVAGLAAKIKVLEAELTVLKSLQASLGVKSGKRKPSVKTKRKRGTNGAIGESILQFLSKKGETGAHVKEIAEALKSKPANITAWFYSTGKKIKGIKKVRPATFAYKGE